jgi:hypothetical protein
MWIALVATKVEIQTLRQEPVRHAGKAEQRILDAAAKQLPAKQAVIKRHCQSGLET